MRKALAVVAVYVTFAWGLVDTVIYATTNDDDPFPWVPLIIFAAGFVATLIVAGCLEKPSGEIAPWVFFVVCLLIINHTTPTRLLDSAARNGALAKSFFSLVLIALAWQGAYFDRRRATS